MAARIPVLSTALALAVSGGALAYQGRTAATLDDTFKTPDPGWDRPTPPPLPRADWC